MSNTGKIAISVAVIAALGVFTSLGIFGVQSIYALVHDGEYPKIIQNIASKFGLEPSAVEQVFEDTRAQAVSDRLEDAVSDGEITAEQKTLILNKLNEVEEKIQAINEQEMTSEARMEAHRNLREEMRDWAEENNIPLRLSMRGGMGYGGGMNRGGFGMGMGMGMFD